MSIPTKVLFVSTSYPNSGADWKGLFHLNIVAALSRRSDLAMHLWLPPGPTPPTAVVTTSNSDALWLQKLMRDGGIAHLLRTRPFRATAQASVLLYRLSRAYRSTSADVLHINWLQNALSLPRNDKPVLLTALGSDMQLLRVPFVAQSIRKALRTRAAIICPNAEWMVPLLERSFSGVAQIHYLPFGIDSKWYEAPRNPASDPSQWLCVTRLTAGKLGSLFEWGESLFSSERRQLHLFGPTQERGIRIPSWVKYHGPIKPDNLRENWFPRATGLVSLSRHPEGRPQVMLEAMASGLPIVASRVSAHEDLLCNNETGLLVTGQDDFSKAIVALEDPIFGRRVGQQARALATKKFGTWDDCAARYAAAYASLWEAKGHER